ncbi:hypothetical protein P9139_17480 [Curtobacterium flaccumfaciens]|nr:hypothetical protein P9139_17480 [Curtobacterium flaccumfaciens]
MLVAAAVLIRPAMQRVVTVDERVRRRTTGAVAITAAVLAFAVVVVYLGGPVLAAVRELPVFDTNPIGRARCVVLFLAAALAGVGFGRLVQPETLRDELVRFRAAGPLRRTGRVLAIVVVLLVGVGVGLQTVTAMGPIPTEYRRGTFTEILIVGIGGIVVAVLVVLVWVLRCRLFRIAAAAVVIALVAVPAVMATKPWWPIAPTSTFYPETPAIEYLEDHVGDQDRYATTGSAMLPGSSSYFQIRETTGHTFQTPEWKQLMRAVDPDTYPTATYLTLSPNLMPELSRSGILDRLSTKYLVADPSAPLAGTTVAGAAQTKWSDLTASNPSVDSGSQSGPLNGITLTGPPAPTTSANGMTLTVSVVEDGTGKTLTSTKSWVPGLGGPRNVALAGSDIPASTSWHIRITVSGQDKLVPIGTDDDGHAVISVTRPAAGDGTTVVHTGDATIYERSTALDRVRWASDQVVQTSATERVRTLADQSLPDDTVVLSARADHTADPDGTATIALRDSDVNATVADVDATAGGWVVVADSLRRSGWTATVDGKATDIVAADNAGGAVWVPAGKHTVALHYAVPGADVGYLVTGVTVGATVAVCVLVTVLVRRRRRRRDADTAGVADIAETAPSQT